MLNKNILYLFLTLVGIILIAPSAEANEIKNNSAPDIMVSSTYTYYLDLQGNCELYTTTNIEHFENSDFYWTPNIGIGVPISVNSFSEEKPKVTRVYVGETDFNYSIIGYVVKSGGFPIQYMHTYSIAVSPPKTFILPKNAVLTIKTTNVINKISIYNQIDDCYQFSIPRKPLTKTRIITKSFTIKINLPNDPYFWVENLNSEPVCDFRSSYGRGESLEWWYFDDEDETDMIMVDYRIHPDALKQELDNATQQSRDISEKSLDISEQSRDISLYSLLIAIVLGGISIVLGVISRKIN